MSNRFVLKKRRIVRKYYRTLGKTQVTQEESQKFIYFQRTKLWSSFSIHFLIFRFFTHWDSYVSGGLFDFWGGAGRFRKKNPATLGQRIKKVQRTIERKILQRKHSQKKMGKKNLMLYSYGNKNYLACSPARKIYSCINWFF